MYFTSSFSIVFASKFINSFSVYLSRFVPAFNISKPYLLKSTPAIFTSSATAFLSLSVVVGDFNNNVSDIIALNINPAICCSIFILFVLYNSNNTVEVHPTG